MVGALLGSIVMHLASLWVHLKSAGARYGVQGTSAVSGYIKPPREPLVNEGLVERQPL